MRVQLKAIVLMMLAGCGGDSTGPGNGNGGGTATPTRIDLNLTRRGAAVANGSEVTVGDTIIITANAVTASGTAISGVDITWSAGSGVLLSSEPRTGATGARATWIVATVPGRQTISVNTARELSATATLDAVAGPATALALQPGYAIFITGSRQLPVVSTDRFGNPVGGSAPQGTWLSVDPAVATITSSGVVTGVAAGTARLVVQGAGRSDTVRLKVLDPAQIQKGRIASDVHACRLAATGQILCWGYGRWGELGNGSLTCSSANAPSCGIATPEPVVSGVRFRYVDVTERRTIAVATDGRVYGWGHYSGLTPEASAITCSGQITQRCVVQPTAFNDVVTVAEAQFADGNLCGRALDGAAYCWMHPFGALGTGFQHEPGFAEGNRSFRALAVSGITTCGIEDSGQAMCWGTARATSSDVQPQACPGSPSAPCYLRPVPVASTLRFTAIAAGEGSGSTTGPFYRAHTCAIAVDRRAHCWGANENGQLGAGITADSSRIIAVAGGLEFAVIGAGLAHTCGTTYAGDTYCWGANGSGQLGIGVAGGNRNTPTLMAGGVTLVEINGTCGMGADDKAYCWGDNTYGQVGTGTRGGSFLSPTLVSGQ